MSEDAEIGPRTVATLALAAVSRSSHSVRFIPVYDKMFLLFRDLSSLKTSNPFPHIFSNKRLT